MEQDNKKKKKIIGISLGVVGALLLLFSGTYAYWQLTKEQSSANEIVAACLDFELSDVTEAISLERAYPISEAESESLTGYTFKVKNNCSDNIDYTIGLNSITNNSENYLANTSLRVKLDDKQSKIYETLNDIEYIENVRYSKELGTSTIQGNSENTHLLKVWVDENAPVTEQGKTFTGKIIITGSVGNTSSGEQIADSCFEIGNDGTLISYDYSCGTNVVVPAEVDGVQVKSVAGIAFKEATVYIGHYNDKTTGQETYGNGVVIKDKEHQSEIEEEILRWTRFMFGTPTEGQSLSDFMTIYDSLTDMLTTFEGEYDDIETYYFDESAGELTEAKSKVTKVDLSEAIYLKSIGEQAFHVYPGYAEDGECGSQTEGKCSLGTLEQVVLPSSGNLETIGEYAFSGNKINGDLIIPDGVTFIGYGAFYHNKLQSVTIPEGVTFLDEITFADNELTNVTLPVGLIEIGYDVFQNNKLTNVTIPNSVTKINEAAFRNNRLQRVIIPSNVTYLGYYAFSDNPLTEVIIKRANADGMNINSSTFNGITPTYNPNYTE